MTTDSTQQVPRLTRRPFAGEDGLMIACVGEEALAEFEERFAALRAAAAGAQGALLEEAERCYRAGYGHAAERLETSAASLAVALGGGGDERVSDRAIMHYEGGFVSLTCNSCMGDGPKVSGKQAAIQVALEAGWKQELGYYYCPNCVSLRAAPPAPPAPAGQAARLERRLDLLTPRAEHMGWVAVRNVQLDRLLAELAALRQALAEVAERERALREAGWGVVRDAKSPANGSYFFSAVPNPSLALLHAALEPAAAPVAPGGEESEHGS